jgi:hypothetical protein
MVFQNLDVKLTYKTQTIVDKKLVFILKISNLHPGSEECSKTWCIYIRNCALLYHGNFEFCLPLGYTDMVTKFRVFVTIFDPAPAPEAELWALVLVATRPDLALVWSGRLVLNTFLIAGSAMF